MDIWENISSANLAMKVGCKQWLDDKPSALNKIATTDRVMTGRAYFREQLNLNIQ